MNASGVAAASMSDSESGTRATQRSWTATRSARPPPRDQAEHAIARLVAEHLAADRLDDAGHLEPGDVLGRARRRRIVAGALVEIGRVEARVPDADDHLAAAGDGVGTVLEVDDLAAADTGEDDASHGGEPYVPRW